MSLTELEIKSLKPKEKRYFASDSRGLILEIKPNGKKFWIIRCYMDKKEKRKYIGEYPEVSLKMAREAALLIKSELKRGSEDNDKTTFGAIADEWMNTRIKPVSSKVYIEKTTVRLEKHILPVLGNKRMNEISSASVLEICRRIEAVGTIETAHRIKQIIGQICRYAVATQRGDSDPTAALKGALQPKREKHYATLTDMNDIALLMANIKEYPRQIIRIAMEFSVLTFCRPGEVRHAEWSEFNFDKCEWRIPAEKMKMRRIHIVPLAKQTVQLLEELRLLTEKWGKWLFPSARMDGRPLSDNGIRTALRSMEYTNDEITPHGFRGMASTVLHENGFSHEIIERQLAHAPRDHVSAAYNHAEYLPERRNMMQWWADWLDGLK